MKTRFIIYNKRVVGYVVWCRSNRLWVVKNNRDVQLEIGSASRVTRYMRENWPGYILALEIDPLRFLL